jgi:L-threonylcarbamoyladenylate synthase
MPDSYIHPWKLREAVRCFRHGGIIAYPTEAMYGLGCDPLNWHAVQRLLQLKQRPVEMGLILIAADFAQLRPFIKPLPVEKMQPILESWPGPNTWLLPAAEGLPFWLRGKHTTLAVRVTDHPIAATLSAACGSPLVSTSANLNNRNPAQNPTQVRARLNDESIHILNGQTGGRKTPSTIRDAETGKVIRG